MPALALVGSECALATRDPCDRAPGLWPIKVDLVFWARTSVVAALLVAVAALAAVVWIGRAGNTGSGGRSVPGIRQDNQLIPRPKPGHTAECDRHGVNRYIEVPDSSAPGGKREIWVHRPPGPDRSNIPVLYFLHGSTTTDRLFTIHQVRLGARLDAQMCRTGIPFVVAAPNGQSADERDTEWGNSADGKLHIEDFVTRTVIRRVEGTHRRPRSLRAVGGVSMGGYGAAAISLRHPRLYSQAACFAGYYHVDDPSHTFGRDHVDHAPDELINDVGVSGIKFFLVEGRNDHTPLHPGSIHGQATRFARLLRARHMTVQVHHPRGGHGFSESWDFEIPAMVDFLDAHWKHAQRG